MRGAMGAMSAMQQLMEKHREKQEKNYTVDKLYGIYRSRKLYDLENRMIKMRIKLFARGRRE